jgi:hypothetical protein
VLTSQELAILLHQELAHISGVRTRTISGRIQFTTAAGKIFVFVSPKKGAVCKLPAARIDALESDGQATHLVMGKRACAEWAVFKRDTAAEYRSLTPIFLSAKSFVESEAATKARKAAAKKSALKKPRRP